MAAPTETYVDPADGAANGNDHGGNAFIDGVFNSGAPNQLTKIGAFTAATCQAGDKIYLDDNGSGEVTAGLYTIATRDSNDVVTLTADIRSGGAEPTDVRCDNHTGAVGLPWATTQHASDFTTRDAANGDRFNIRDTADDVLAAVLDHTAYGVPANTAPWILQGYTTVAGDGGIGGISGGAAVAIINNSGLNYVHIRDMHLHNCGAAAYIVYAGTRSSFTNLEVDNCTGTAGLRTGKNATITKCRVHNIQGIGIYTSEGSQAFFNTLENGANDFTFAINMVGDGGVAAFNVIDIDGASDGITTAFYSFILGNSIYSSAGTGQGIVGSGFASVISNIVEGFSGVGGVGINMTTGIYVYGYNAFYNNTTNETNGDIFVDLGNNQALAGAGNSPFIDAANADFRIKPSVQALGYPTADYPNLAVRSYLDIGALQRMSQMLTHPGMAGGARG